MSIVRKLKKASTTCGLCCLRNPTLAADGAVEDPDLQAHNSVCALNIVTNLGTQNI